MVEDLPEVRAAVAAGWFLAPDAPMWVFLPPLWPKRARAWVPDRSTHYMVGACTSQPSRRVPWTQDVIAEMEQNANSELERCGLPARPANRIWLLKPPPSFGGLDDVLGQLCKVAHRRGVEPIASRSMAEVAAGELEHVFAVGPLNIQAGSA